MTRGVSYDLKYASNRTVRFAVLVHIFSAVEIVAGTNTVPGYPRSQAGIPTSPDENKLMPPIMTTPRALSLSLRMALITVT